MNANSKSTAPLDGRRFLGDSARKAMVGEWDWRVRGPLITALVETNAWSLQKKVDEAEKAQKAETANT